MRVRVCPRRYLSMMMNLKGRKGWPMVQKLVVELLEFMHPYLRQVELSDSVRRAPRCLWCPCAC